MALKPPPASSEAVRNTMLANRSTDTGPERAVRRMLREAGHPGYRLHWRIDEEELRRSGDLFYRWQYVMRWSATTLRKDGVMLDAADCERGTWAQT